MRLTCPPSGPRSHLVYRLTVKTLFALCAAVLLPGAAHADPPTVTLLNVSYDVTRGFYQEYNPVFVKDWQLQHHQQAVVTMSHGGSSAQVSKVLDGLDADVVTMNQETDIDTLADAKLVAKDWKSRFPNGSVPYTSTILFLVRAGNPQGIRDWDDLVKPGVRIIVPNPKTSGNGRYSYLAAYGYALKKNGGDEAKAKEFTGKLFKNAAVLDTGGRAATTTFAQRGIGDVLLTFENEVYLIKNDPTLGGDKLQVVVPSVSIRAEAPVALVEKFVDQHGTRAVADAYLRAMFTPAAQEVIARSFYRPVDQDVFARHADTFQPLELFDVQTTFGGWAKAQKVHFADGGVFDQIYQP